MYKSICLLLLILVCSCKGTKSLKTTDSSKYTGDKVISSHYKKSFNFMTLNANVKLRYNDGDKSFSPSGSIRIEKDKTIWVSIKMLGITFAKALITPDKVSYYEKVNNTYFDGDFSMLSEWLGTDLDFQKVQNMLLGQALFDLREDAYTNNYTGTEYLLKPKKENLIFDRLFFIDPAHFKITSQQLTQLSEKRNLSIKYPLYQRVGGQDFPKQIYIDAIEDTDQSSIKIEYRSVDYNARVNFPFKIPPGYKQVTIK